MSRQQDGKAKRADATRAALISAAERLIAEKGLASVSTREILQEAGQRNQSALQYHFGSKEGLMRATISERTRQIDEKRLNLMKSWKGKPTLDEVLEVLILPLAELAEEEIGGKHYILFLCQAITQPDWDLRQAIKDFELIGLGKAYEYYDELLADLPEEARIVRQEIAYDVAILTLKRWCIREMELTPKQITKLVIHANKAILEPPKR
ncbi:TetR/AcrR family transcriptional regulator [Kordiimonas lipolytica]|uniref:TetR/AcrR family transcriptional regulator n=1 Tax=Kordiimonas lipolytica TaxID=1662421 RepID=A0ABV8U9A7_9PROT|nr:TetR/AcrR family transcriptional regulator [Kordiimonas lipolytica]